jgi:vacuolar-type H+-ATPase subunit H
MKMKANKKLLVIAVSAALMSYSATGSAGFSFKIPTLNDIKNTVEKAADDTVNTFKKAERDAAHTLQKAKEDSLRAVAKAERDTAHTLQKAKEDTLRAAAKAERDAAHALQKAKEDSLRAAAKAERDAARTIEQAKRDTINETKRASYNLNDLSLSVGHYLENTLHSTGDSLANAEQRVREGKIVDAIWHLVTDPGKNAEKNFGIAATESSLVNYAGAAAASIYGGPSGAAKYSAWYTYNQTGDLEQALKAGLIAGATASGLEMVNSMPDNSGSELVRKSLAAASIGGAAVAASGGDADDIRDAILKGGAIPVIQSVYSDITKGEITGKGATQDAVAKLKSDGNVKSQYTILEDEQGTPILDLKNKTQVDMRYLPKSISSLGTTTSNPSAGFFSGHETSAPMQFVGKYVPYANDMSTLHDQLVGIMRMNTFENVATILPAYVITVSGSEAPILVQVNKENTEEKNSD